MRKRRASASAVSVMVEAIPAGVSAVGTSRSAMCVVATTTRRLGPASIIANSDDAGARGQVLGVAREGEAGARDPLLRDGRGHEGRGLAAQHGVGRGLEVGELRAAPTRRWACRGRRRSGAERRDDAQRVGRDARHAGALGGGDEHDRIAEDEDAPLGAHGERAHDDLRPDAGRISQRDREREAVRLRRHRRQHKAGAGRVQTAHVGRRWCSSP